MNKTQLKKILIDAYSAGENDTYAEDELMTQAQEFISNEIELPEGVEELTDEEHSAIQSAYRAGFMGHTLQDGHVPYGALAKVVEYLLESERTHYEESGKSSAHIYRSVTKLNTFLKRMREVNPRV